MKTRVNICSALRQGSRYTKSFIHQRRALTEKGYEIGSINIVVDGDMLTDEALIEASGDGRMRIVFEGKPGAPTCFMRERSVAWARTGNLALENSLNTPSDFTLWVESDLCFPCDLIELLMASGRDIVAPVVMLGDSFYDSWGFRDLAGRRIDSLAALQSLPRTPGSLIELSSVGSCLLFRTELLSMGVRMPGAYEDGLLVGFCLAARAKGARVYCRYDALIVHPTSLWAEQVYRVTSCRTGDGAAWAEISPTEGAVLAGPYFDFVIPEALRLLAATPGVAAWPEHVTFSSNSARQIAISLGHERSLPPVPDGFAAPTRPQPMPMKPDQVGGETWWRSLFHRLTT